jgi:predicted glycosyltransferase
MGGYNTFCEILSFDKPGVIIPRTKPRLEQYIRASRAQELGLMSLLNDDGIRNTSTMITALRQLPQQSPPSNIILPGLLDGLPSISRLAGKCFDKSRLVETQNENISSDFIIIGQV